MQTEQFVSPYSTQHKVFGFFSGGRADMQELIGHNDLDFALDSGKTKSCSLPEMVDFPN